MKQSFDAVFNLPERDRDRGKEIRRKKERGAETGIRIERAETGIRIERKRERENQWMKILQCMRKIVNVQEEQDVLLWQKTKASSGAKRHHHSSSRWLCHQATQKATLLLLRTET